MSIYDVPEESVPTFWSWEIFDPCTLDTYIYVIQEGEDGPIKLGCSKHPRKRMQELQVGNPNRLHLILQRKGDRLDEKRLHHMLSVHHLSGEWFEYCFPVRTIIEELNE